MTNAKPASLIEQLDARQNEVLRQLDELETRVKHTIQTWTDSRDDRETVNEKVVNPPEIVVLQ